MTSIKKFKINKKKYIMAHKIFRTNSIILVYKIIIKDKLKQSEELVIDTHKNSIFYNIYNEDFK